MDTSRRTFLKTMTAAAAGITAVSLIPGFSAKSYARIVGANNRLNFALIGINGRGEALLKAALATSDSAITHVCDVDTRVIDKSKKMVTDLAGNTPEGIVDIRKLLEIKDIDAVAIAMPDHWHAPAAIMAMQAGKHVYVEKPCGHNPREGELIIEAVKKYGKICQMGNQQRSAPTSIKAIEEIRNGVIGKVYYGKAWYSNARGPIGNGKETAVPDWLNWDLWQGPAPRRVYKDNYVHYNWHWFWHWGTGETCNNATHELDICRWAMGLDYPERVSSAGGRLHHEGDDWEFYDTQIVNYEFPDNKLITWEGKSCNSFQFFDRGRGATLHGTNGTILIDRNGYLLYDAAGKLVKEEKEQAVSATTDTKGAGALDLLHMINFADAIRLGAKQNSPMDEGHKSTLLCHLGNIAQKYHRTLAIDPQNGHILDKEAMKMWGRTYEKGWEIKL